MLKEPVRFRFSAFADEIDPSFDAQLTALREMGIPLLELRGVDGESFVALTDAQVKTVRNKLHDAGVGLSALGSPVGKIRTDGDFCEHMKLFGRIMDIGEMLDCRRIRMFSFYPGEKHKDRGKDYEETVFEWIGRLLDVAERRGFVLCHENEKDIYGASVSSEKRLLARFGGRLKAVLDPGNFAFCLMDARPSYLEMKDYVEYMHLKDADETGAIVVPGKGKACLREILSDISSDPARAGQTMILTVEPHLMDFVGLASLAAAELRQVETFRSPREAFETAYKALLPMVEEAGEILP